MSFVHLRETFSLTRTQKDGLATLLLLHFLPPFQLFPPRPFLALPSSSVDKSNTRLMRPTTTILASPGGPLSTVSGHPPSPLPTPFLSPVAFWRSHRRTWRLRQRTFGALTSGSLGESLGAVPPTPSSASQCTGRVGRSSPAWALRPRGQLVVQFSDPNAGYLAVRLLMVFFPSANL